MKFKLIALAAMLAAGSAQAAIVNGSSDNGELFMTVLDSVGQQSYTLDLNITMNDFLAGVAANASYSYAADANMSSFLSMVAPANQSGLLFAIGAMDSNGSTATNYFRNITTASVIDLGNTLTNTNLKNLSSNGDVFVADFNSLIGANNSLIVTDPSFDSYAGSAFWGSNWGNQFNGTSTSLIGDDVGMYFLRQSSGVFAARNSASIYEALSFNGNPYMANLDMNGNLMIAAVPEAETYAMMLAGLGLVGFMVARRRRAA
ncbi:MAG: PEP-CTERM sorting domain-containing protein [Candidatus Paracaedibacteraceae bacterium]|nr:PEP-CTERM sorting domain-containing protein [Candidatus Paracaedibacteraceae bacterium]